MFSTADPMCLMMMSLTSSVGKNWTCPASGRAGGKHTHTQGSNSSRGLNTLQLFCSKKNMTPCEICVSCRKGESVQELMSDKQHIEEQRARYQAYQTVVDEVEIEPGESAASYGLDDYDDEYDDTYDMNQVGANDADGESLLNRR